MRGIRWWGLWLVLLGSCAPLAPLRTARITEPGTWELEAGYGVLDLTRLRTAGAGDHPGNYQEQALPLPAWSVGVRHGLLDWLDVGARLSTPVSLELEAGLGVAEGPVAVAVAPSVGARLIWSSIWHLSAQLPLLVTVAVVPARPRLVEVTVGAVGRLEHQLWTGGFPTEQVVYAGALAGLSTRPWRGLFFRLELLWLRPVYNSAPALSPKADWGTDFLHCDLVQLMAAGGWVF